ncbi:hypothetical protein EIP91_011505 [Steccherinum ochraceum]|uniref:Coenzyme Q-binding protein COQ10 START domain-containing protein n=1 Tax=Steccherinum ochraceum TaxID=92696 RepID=A0A4R0RRQ9_9APHY|nr:hypothetical protein EIP91_011505 [Steccherinum ochraceum]
MSSGPPTPDSKSGWTLSTSQIIDAPVEKVWETLLDFPSYPEWNPFVRKQLVKDKSGRLADPQVISQGAVLDMTTHIPHTMDDTAKPTKAAATVTIVDNENHRVSWKYKFAFNWLLKSVRWQTVTATEDGKAKYESVETFTGLLVGATKSAVGDNLQKAFIAMGEALKARAEESS